MTENNANKDINKYLFINLVTMLSMSAMQQLGKIINPGAGKAEISLDAAQATIDMLDMLSAKTKGNLDNEEARMMKDTLSMLKMNFVETKDEEGRKAKEQSSNPEPQKSEVRDQQDNKKTDIQENSKVQETGNNKTETEDPKFHKSYG